MFPIGASRSLVTGRSETRKISLAEHKNMNISSSFPIITHMLDVPLKIWTYNHDG